MTTSFDGVKDSGERREFGTGSVRDVRTGKGRYDLLPALAIKRLAQHYENGAVKYGDHNWKLGQPLSGYLDSGLRHTFNVLDLQVDEDHPAAAIWNMISFLWTAEEIRAGRLPRELDDIGYIDALEAAEKVTITHLETDYPQRYVMGIEPNSNTLEFTAERISPETMELLTGQSRRPAPPLSEDWKALLDDSSALESEEIEVGTITVPVYARVETTPIEGPQQAVEALRRARQEAADRDQRPTTVAAFEDTQRAH